MGYIHTLFLLFNTLWEEAALYSRSPAHISSVMTGEVFEFHLELGFSSCFYFLGSCHIFAFSSRVRTRVTLTYHISYLVS